eukprot:262452-Rhodomonas_salina.1
MLSLVFDLAVHLVEVAELLGAAGVGCEHFLGCAVAHLPDLWLRHCAELVADCDGGIALFRLRLQLVDATAINHANTTPACINTLRSPRAHKHNHKNKPQQQ